MSSSSWEVRIWFLLNAVQDVLPKRYCFKPGAGPANENLNKLHKSTQCSLKDSWPECFHINKWTLGEYCCIFDMLLLLIYKYQLEGYVLLAAKANPLHIPFPNWRYHSRVGSVFFFFFFLKYNKSIMFCQPLLYSRVTQLYACRHAFLNILFCCALSQGIEYSFPYYTVECCFLSILNTIVYIC